MILFALIINKFQLNIYNKIKNVYLFYLNLRLFISIQCKKILVKNQIFCWKIKKISFDNLFELKNIIEAD